MTIAVAISIESKMLNVISPTAILNISPDMPNVKMAYRAYTVSATYDITSVVLEPLGKTDIL
jgi:hypothetical protein